MTDLMSEMPVSCEDHRHTALVGSCDDFFVSHRSAGLNRGGCSGFRSSDQTVRKCTSKHTGTSASAPMAAAIIALALEANPDLTWRDVQHIMVRTSNPANLQAPDWKMNGVGRKVSHNYGYGLMDAQAMVELSRKWITMPPQQSCEVVSPYYYKVIPAMGFVTIELDVNSCPGVRWVSFR